MAIDKEQFYGTLTKMKEASQESVDAHMPTFQREFGESVEAAQKKYEVTKSTDQALARSDGVLEIVRITEGVSDEIRYMVAHMLNMFLLRDEWVQGTNVGVFMSGLTQKLGDEVRLIHKELANRKHEELLRPSFLTDRN